VCFDGVVKFEVYFWKGKEEWKGEEGIKTVISEAPMMTFFFSFGSSKRSMYSIIGTPKLIVGRDFLSLLGTLMILFYFFCRYVVTMYIHQFTPFLLAHYTKHLWSWKWSFYWFPFKSNHPLPWPILDS